MYELVYCSKAIQELTVHDIQQILNTARNFNAQVNITGCLLFHNHQFVQILEGDQNKVTSLFDNINKDERHYAIQIINEGTKKYRTFKTWNMAYYDLSSDQVDPVKREQFITNFINYCELADRPTFPVSDFWETAYLFLSQQTEVANHPSISLL